LGAESVSRLIFQSYGNEGVNLTKKHLEGFPKLERLILSSNNVNNLGNDLFADKPELTWLDLRANNVRLRLDTFQNSSNLTVLELGQNHICNEHRTGCVRQIDEIDFAQSMIDGGTAQKRRFSHPPRRFVSGFQLDKHYRVGKKLSRVSSEGYIKGLHSLSVLKLYLNELTSLPDGIFSDTQALTEIDLSENHFTSISR
ncbi:uncharacterized protein LOC143218563, partial [Lasioglossum baleicum]|uniref:uncharacterized protein LOC143218563 n=1 Tax=Lasioglossum baleicum TaxID=434251 RepID=UPI003FCE2F74